MNTNIRFILSLTIFYAGLILPGFGQNGPVYENLQRGFQNPPSDAHPIVYHWWLGGHVDTVRLKEEIHAFKEAGVSGFTIFEIGSRDTVLVGTGPEFLGEESLKTIQLAVEEAGKLGMEVGLNTASSWNAGGKWMTPEHAAKSIYQSKVSLSGGSRQRMEIPFPEIPEMDPRGRKRMIEFGADGKPVYAEEIALLAIPEFSGESLADTSQIRDISEFFNPETEVLDWEAPEGKWKIVRYVSSNSGENLILPSKYSAGPIVDHYDADATAFHFNYIIDRLQSVLGDLSQTALKSLYMASYEARGFTWTPTLPEKFKAINGYEVKKLLPILFEEADFSAETTANFRADFQRTLSELMIQNFYMKSKEVCNAHGLKNNSEAGGPGLPLHNVPVEPLKALGKGLDIPRGEFWINHGRYNADGMDILRVIKEVSSASHIYGLGIVEMEAFTSFQHWQEGPFEMKPVGDRAFAEGMNKVVVHGSTHNPEGTGFPGIVYHAGTHYNDKRVWWPKIRPFNEYLARVSYILQEADFKADFLYYYGDTIPNYGGHKQGRFSPGAGYDYELVNTEILLGLEVQDGEIVNPRNGAKFSVLALAEEYEIHPEVLIKLKEMAEKGAIIIGPRPNEIAQRKLKPGMPDMEGWLEALWQPYNDADLIAGEAVIYEDVDPTELMSALGIAPDIDYEDKAFYTLDYTHYEKGDVDFYFVVNTTGNWLSRNVHFRQQDKVPQIWDPVTGQITQVGIYEQKEDQLSLPLTLAPYESKFVTFAPGNSKNHFSQIVGAGLHPPKMRFVEGGIEIWEEGIFVLSEEEGSHEIHGGVHEKEIDGAWEVFFPEGWGAPEKAVFPELKSWTTSDVEGIKYFSGTARYEKQFIHALHPTDHAGAKTYLDLGDLSHVAEVWLNDERLGITWSKPYRFDVTDLLRPGINTLRVEVANTWSNRITGDALTGETLTQTHIEETNIKGISHIRVPWEEVPLIPSGLFGPVMLRTVVPVSLPQSLQAARVFSDNMVLQRDQPIPVWGVGTAGDEVAVRMGNKTARTRVSSNGNWEVALPAFPAGGPYSMNIEGTKKVEFNNVLIGDVWLASGQSNMQHPIGGWEWIPHSEIRNADRELADSDYPEIRLFDVPLFPSPEPAKDLSGGSWKKPGPESLADFSAPAWFFAKALHRELGIPIGIIHTSWGGTSILTWTNEQTLLDFSDSLPQRESNIRYAPHTWENQVKAAFENHRMRRNKVSYPDPEIKQMLLEPGFSAKGWKKLDLFDDTAAYGEVLWVKRQVMLEQELATADLTLQLGFLNRQSHVYWNGKELGYFQYPAPVSIRVPTAWVKKGINEITVRLSNPWGSVTFHGAPEKYALTVSSREFQLSLASSWKGIKNQEPIPPARPFYVNEPSFLFNGMISPLIPYGIKGFIWDQGGADARRPRLYEQLFKRLIQDWRTYWKNEELPFLFVQNTSTYSSHEFEKRTFVRSPLREAQETALELPHTGMVVSIDIGDPYDVHPKNKQEFGRRLALQALEKVYDQDIEADGPHYGSHQVKGDRVIVNVKDSGQQLVLDCTGESCGFELADADGVFHPASAVLQGNTIRVHSGEVTQPTALRYAWGDYPPAGVFNQEGLPLAPFRVTLAD